MQYINEFFETLVFKYIEEKQGYGVYGAGIASLIGGDMQKVVLAFVPKHLAVKQQARLASLPWKNVQLRTVPLQSYNLRPQAWVFPHGMSNFSIRVRDRSDRYTTYVPEITTEMDFPFDVLLIHDPRKKSNLQYPNTTTFHWAADQFKTVLNYVGPDHPIHHSNEGLSQSSALPLLPTFTPVSVPVIRPPPFTNPLGGWLNASTGGGNTNISTKVPSGGTFDKNTVEFL
jgi:hypothetical protein